MITEDARALLATGGVCDSCLGRPFADRSFGLTNAERGRALRTTVALADDEDFDPTPPTDCWVCEGYCGTFDPIADAVVEALEGVDFATYQVGTQVPPLVEENDRLLREDAGLEPDVGESLKREVNREVGRRVGARTGAEVDFDRPDVLAVVDLEGFDPREALETGSVTGHAVDVQINPAFVYGRYRKLERDIPQTEWPCRECGGSGIQLGDDGEEPCDYCGGSGYMYDTSVEQTVRPHVVAAMDGDEGTFHGAGREDVDARMLEEGRPFVLEVKRPHERDPDPAELEAKINEAADGSVEVEGLRLATYEMVERVKEHDASKHYRADVEFSEPVDEKRFDEAIAELDGTTLAQETPQRVDHRRAALTRERTVYDLEGELRSSTEAEVRLHGEGGLYVKEFVSGDDGRTEPSLAGTLGVDAEVTALDVTGVEGEDEPFEREEYFLDEPRDGDDDSDDDGSDRN
ncbi:tRNA pseudouridine(54/55) synthase Pus10 [Halobiforma lacisalsi AJ5]|uniref:tRNA pseudouridine synthase Pus10 n=1 Tax=Natronobacterium lacisalsi AJ5 TaxID=358396 RepID=M0LII8_NATLA|nr:tRNA pseudouridine(54/55) synthase Pus10 [Halobiforma lacisalsi]APW96414.1 tRNA pseudouridine(54/55) synthase Pus10 [Halobiforma lacisalsi AJ5]EMA31815.1 pseudouridylate synthase [Halobiforma lacisalsi AJ5]